MVLGVVIATVGSVAALNGWFGGGSAIPQDTNTRGLMGYWNFDEGSRTMVHDASDNGNNGTLVTGATTTGWTTGKIGSAFNFDGTDDYLEVNDSASLKTFTSMTIEGWLKLSPRTDGNHHTIVVKNWDYWLGVLNSSGVARLQIVDAAGNPYYASTAVRVDDNTWHHVVAVWDGTMIQMYVDGVASGSSAAANIAIRVGTTTMRIGGDTNNPPVYSAEGSIDEVRIYNRALSAAEIHYHYNRGGPMGYWKMDEGEGRMAYDSTENNNDGTLILAGSATSSTWVVGQFGTALSFDGVDDYVSAGTSNTLQMTGTEVTVSAWIKTSQTSVGYIFSRGKLTTPWDGYAMAVGGGGTANGKLGFWYGNGVNWDFSNSNINDNRWHHVVVAFDSSKTNFYIDGELDATVKKTGTVDINSSAMTAVFGYDPSVPGRYYNGLLDDLRVYNYVRTADEISLDYNAGLGTHFGPSGRDCKDDPAGCLTEGLVAYWDMDESSGQIVYDRSNYANNGTRGATIGASTDDPSWDKGKIGGGLSFDGTGDYVNYDVNLLDGAVAGTISMWFKRGAWTESYTTLLTKSNGGGWANNHIQISRVASTDTINLTISDNVLSTTDSVKTGTINAGQWYYITMTWDGANLIGYVDGVEVGRYATSIIVASDSTLFAIGKGAVGTNRFFNGLIDEVRIYNRALSVEEIRYQYNKGGPLGYWKMDEGGGRTVYDSTSNNNDGTLVLAGSATSSAWVSGKYGGALSFDGTDDYVDLGSSANFRQTTTLSVEAWFNTGAMKSDQTIVACGRLGNIDGWIMDYANQYLRWYAGNDASVYAQAILSPAINTWYHVVGTFDSAVNKKSLYVNGVLIDSDNLGTVSYSTSFSTYIGKDFNGDYFNGLIDEVRIYNYARTQEQIRQDYNAGLAVHFGPSAASCDQNPGACVSQGLVGYWDFDENNGATAHDGSGNNKNGLISDCVNGHTDNGDGTCTATFYPDADPENTSVDGSMYHEANLLWHDIQAAAGNNASDSGTTGSVGLMTAGAGYWWTVYRFLTLFDTTSLPDASTINSATLGIYGSTKAAGLNLGIAINVYSSNPAGNTSVVVGDFATLGTTAYSTAITYANWSAAGYNNFALNAAGLAAISKTDITKFGFRESNYDAPDVTPAHPTNWASDYIQGYLADQAGTSNDPKLVVTYRGAGTSWVTGRVGGALDFTDSSVSIGDVYNGIKSVEFWVKADNTTKKIMDLSNTAYVEVSGGTVAATGWTSPTIYVNGTQSSTIAANTWQHVVITTDAGINATSTSFGRVISSYFDGALDEIKFYSRPLSATEVRYHYNKGGPVAQWKMDEGEGRIVYDSTTNNNDGTLVLAGSATSSAWVSGKYGGALSFDGTDDYVSCGTNSSLTSAQGTIELWARRSAVGTAEQNFLDLFESQWTDYLVIGVGATNRLNLRIEDGDVAKINISSPASITMADTNWHHLVFTQDGTGGKIYLDGINTNASGVDSTYWSSHLTLTGCWIGKGSWGNFNGLIDDVRIYNYVRTQEQIKQDYNAGLSVHFK